MNGRERFNAVLDFKTPDRGFNHELGVWGQALDRWQTEGLPRDVIIGDLIRGNQYFGVERIEYLGLDVLGMYPPFDEEVLEEDERYLVKRYADGRITKALKEGEAHGTRASMDQGLSWPVKDAAGWEDVKRRYNPRSPARYGQWWGDVTRCLAGRDYPLAVTHNGCFGLFSFLRTLMGTEAACLLWYDNPKLGEEMLDYLTDYLLEVLHPALHQVQADYFNYFEDFAYKGGPLLGPKLFRKYLMPRYRRINDFLRSHGVQRISLDSDGNTEVLIPLFIELGITMHWPLERASNMDPLKIRAQYGHDLALAGGIDKRPLAQGKRAIEEELYHHVPQLLEDGGYIPTLDHTAPPDVPYENWLYYLKLKCKLLGIDPATVPALADDRP